MIQSVQKDLKTLGNPKKAKILARFFKTGQGEYGEGDAFLGISVPDVRSVARRYIDMGLEDVESLLNSQIHECRLAALLVLSEKFKKAAPEDQSDIYELYLKNAKKVNNWDLVDLSAHHIVGEYLQERKKDMLYTLAKSNNLWARRISIVATYAFIRKDKFDETLKIAEMLLNDKHDLIHKAVGWMLREVGKRDQEAEERFLRKHCKTMPRTALRYAIEKFGQKKKKFYMKKD